MKVRSGVLLYNEAKAIARRLRLAFRLWSLSEIALALVFLQGHGYARKAPPLERLLCALLRLL